MKKTIGSLPVWQFVLLLVAVLAAFTLLVRVLKNAIKPQPDDGTP